MDQFDTTTPPKKTLGNRATMAGLYIAAVTIVLGLIVYIAGLNEAMMTNKPLSWANNILSLGLMFYFIHTAIRMYRDQDNGGYLTVGNGMGLGTLAGLVAGVVTAIWMIIFMTFIAPDLMEMTKRVTMEQMQASGQSEEQVEEAMEMADMFFSPVFISIMIAIFSIFFGFLCGLVSGLIQKRDRPYAS
ncbi:MAG: DUF4199 domain-containing protein [Saprospiraceae bacterium]|nr:DUF4199 domain-containing protein [Saprospiraceae bacterium]